jgi:hypothetical protein
MTALRPRLAGLACAAAVLVAVGTPSEASGAGRTYEVVQCDPLNRGVSGVTMDDAPSYAVKQMCGDPREDHAIKIDNIRFAQHGRSGRVKWSTRSPSLRIVGAEVQAKLRRHNGHIARLWMADSRGHEIAPVARGAKHPTAFRRYSWHSTGAGAAQLVASLSCESRQDCKQSGLAKTWLRNVHLEVADYSDPSLTSISGGLVQRGWLRGTQGLSVQGTDLGSGLRTITTSVNGQDSIHQIGQCGKVARTSYAHRFFVCGTDLALFAHVSTFISPFRDGRNILNVCGVDFAANRTCATRRVNVDNTPPTLSFTNFQNPNDPELIRVLVADETSGLNTGQLLYRAVGSSTWRPLTTDLASGQLRTRIDSTIDAPGRYEFAARATDAAGNGALTTSRADGRPMILTFPLKSGVRLKAHMAGGGSKVTRGYGRTTKVSGFLHDASGKPLANETVTVTERFGQGALISRRVRRVQTNPHGRWKERLPSGPSRRVVVSYVGTRRYLPDEDVAGRFRVKSKAILHLSRRRVPEGQRVAFKGRIGHLAARIPSRGKLVELQVKDGRRWLTVRHPFYTRPNGKYRLRYRFARFYRSNVRYRFRIRVIRERDWPYKAPVSSRVRKLVVKAR